MGRKGGKESLHEQSIDLHDVVEPGRGIIRGDGAPGAQRADEDLRDDGAYFARGGRDAVGRGAVARGEAFAGDDEGGCVGAEAAEGKEMVSGAEIFRTVGRRKMWGLRT